MKKRYQAFTLVEILIVMGILIILLGVGISIGRYAIRQSQDVHHRDAARGLYAALVKYKNINRQYPRIGSCSNCIEEEFFAYALGFKGVADDHILKPYLEDESMFDGGSDATYYYGVDDEDAQVVIVCVSFGGIDDENERGFFCTGDGLGYLPPENPIRVGEIESQADGDIYAPIVKGLDDSDWNKDGGFASSTL